MQEGPSGSATRVLIASDAPYAVTRLETLAGYSDQVSLVGFSRETSELEEDIRLLRPDVLLVHEGFGHLDIISLVAELAEHVPGLGVVVVLDAPDDVLTARLARSGVATMVASSAEGQDLIAAIDRAVSATTRPESADLTAPPVLPWMPEPGWPPPPPEAPSAGPPGPAVWTPDFQEPPGVPPAQPPQEPAVWMPASGTGEMPPAQPPQEPAVWMPASGTGEMPPAQPPQEPAAWMPASGTGEMPPAQPPQEPAAWMPGSGTGEMPPAQPPREPASQPGVPVFQLDDVLAAEAPVETPLPVVPQRVPEPVPRPRPPRRSSKERAELFVVFSGKGGVGKSVIATNLAVALAARGGRVAIVDLDLQFGDVAVMLHAENHPTAIDALAQQGEQVDSDFIEEVMATGPEGVRALLAPASPEFADLVNTANLRAILRELATTYDQIVVDTPAHLEERNLEAIEMADQIVVVTNYNITAIKDTKVTLKLLQSLGIPKERICLVLNQTRAKVGFPRAEIDESLRFPVVAALPFELRVDEFIDAGRTIVVAEPKSEFSKQIRVLVEHLSPAVKGAHPGARGERQAAGTNRRRFSLGRS